MKKFSEACVRNQVPIYKVLKEWLPKQASVLEVGSGTGQHAAYFTEKEPDWLWQTSDVDQESLNSILAYQQAAASSNFYRPLALSLTDSWQLPNQYDVLYCANVLHITAWEIGGCLFQRAAESIVRTGTLVIYGPFWQETVKPVESNLAFDKHLRARHCAWGIRPLSLIEASAKQHGFELEQIRAMPANNIMLKMTKAFETPDHNDVNMSRSSF